MPKFSEPIFMTYLLEDFLGIEEMPYGQSAQNCHAVADENFRPGIIVEPNFFIEHSAQNPDAHDTDPPSPGE